MAALLSVAGEPALSAWIEDVLVRAGHSTRMASDVAGAIHDVAESEPDVIVSDARLADGTALDLLRRLRDQSCDLPVIVLGDSSLQHAVLAMRQGATDVVPKPLDDQQLTRAIADALELKRLRPAPAAAARTPQHAHRPIIGTSSALRRALETLGAVAATRAPVLLEGESGTGKELFAREIHDQSPRRGRPFITVNCAALPEGLVESALFGHERGAFTGATARAAGAFERADGGTLLLDEISEMRLDLQAKLLRALQEQEFERVGGHQLVRVDVRVVATTNRDLEREVEAGRFRGDLFYRLNVVPVRTPALRDRLEDLPALVAHFVARSAREMGVPEPEVAPGTLEFLRTLPWPGNIRELSNAVQRAVILSRGGRLSPQSFGAGRSAPADLPGPSGPSASAAPMTAAPAYHGGDGRRAPEPISCATPLMGEMFDLDTLERDAIQRALTATRGHRGRAAALLGISDRTLRKKLNGETRLAA